jgi:hypothetical protein
VALARGAWQEARSAFERTLTHGNAAENSPRGANPEQANAEILSGMAEALWWLGEITEAVRCWEQAYAAFRRLDPM